MTGATLPIPERFNAAEYFVERHHAEGRGGDVAVLCRDQKLTYGQIWEQVNRAANALARRGVERLDRVLMLLPDSPAFVAAFWGAIRLGAVPVPVNTALPAEDLEFMLRDSEARALVVHESLLAKIAPARRRAESLRCAWVDGPAAPGFLSFDEEVAQSPSEVETAPTHRDDPAFWLYTSGSTGRPKGVIHLQHDMVDCLESLAKQVLQLSAADRTFSASKLSFAYGLGNGLYFPFGVGASTVLLAERPTPERILEILRTHRPTVFFAVPSIYAALLQEPSTEASAFASVRAAVSAGEVLPAPLWERFHKRFGVAIVDGIGSTEMLHTFISNRPDDIVPGSSGRIVPGYEARIVDEQGHDLPEGQIGNLWVKGESAAAGYWNRLESTAATFRGEWTATGDKYRRDERGYFWYCGRADDMMKVRGLWVAPLEIESALLAHPAVSECAVVGTTDEDGLTKPKAFVVLKDGAPASPELDAELASFLRERLPGYKIPRWFEARKSLPRTPTGKLQRFKLR